MDIEESWSLHVLKHQGMFSLSFQVQEHAYLRYKVQKLPTTLAGITCAHGQYA